MVFFKKYRLKKLLISNKTEIIHTELTSNCNLKCTYCAVSLPDYKGKLISKDNLSKVSEVINDLQPEIICYNGHGESTIYPGWSKFVDNLELRSTRHQITTNLSKKYSDSEIKTLSELDWIVISLDSFYPEKYAYLRRGGDLELVLENIKKIQEVSVKDIHFRLNCVITDRNAFDLEHFVQEASKYKVKSIAFIHLSSYYSSAEKFLKPIVDLNLENIREAYKCLLSAGELCKKNGIEYVYENQLMEILEDKISELSMKEELKPKDSASTVNVESKNEAFTKNCTQPWTFMMLTADGGISACCVEPAIDNLSNHINTKDLRNSKKINQVKERLLTGKLAGTACETCTWKSQIAVADFQNSVSIMLENSVKK